MSDYADIIARLESASGPDRELDAAIAIATFVTVHTDEDLIYARPRDPGYDATHPGDYFVKSRSGAQAQLALPYTASIDAALTLLPAEANSHGYSLDKHGVDAYVSRNDVNEGHFYRSGVHKTSPAIALCIAALKARASLHIHKHGGEE